MTPPLGIVCVRMSAEDRAVVEAVAALSRETFSATVRDLLRQGARGRLRELPNPDRRHDMVTHGIAHTAD